MDFKHKTLASMLKIWQSYSKTNKEHDLRIKEEFYISLLLLYFSIFYLENELSSRF